MKTLAIIILVAGRGLLGLAADAPIIRSVFLKDSEIYVSVSPGGPPQQLTHDGLGKSLPVWSPDGSRIAFTRESPDHELTRIIVISPEGKTLQDISFRPAESHISGMRFVEELEWISDERLYVCGSLNPSTVEYVVVDASTGKEMDWYAADGFSLVPSPDAKHVAYEGYVPHFTAEAEMRPRLCFDHECDFGKPDWPGYPGSKRHVELLTDPVWSPSGAAVAILAQQYETGQLFLLTRPLEGKAAEYTVPIPPPDRSTLNYSARRKLYSVFWTGDGVFLKIGESAWQLPPRGSALIRIGPGQFHSDLDAACKLREIERNRLAALGASQVDSWCEACPLSLLPRSQGPKDVR